MHEVGAAFVAGLVRVGSMRASLSAHGHQSQTYDDAGDAALIGRWSASSGTDVYGLLARLRSATGVDGAFVVELSGEPAGGYAVDYHAGGHGGVLPALEPMVVRDAEYRYPDHPPAGMLRPAAAANDGRPTDPDVLVEVRTLVEQFVAEHTRRSGAPPDFGPGYREAEILAAEHQLGVRLPEDLRALYRVIHDDGKESGLLGPFSPAPLERVVAWYHEDRPASYGWNDDLFADIPVVFETHPYGHVRRVSRSDWWVTFAPDHGGNYAVVDLDPAGSGTYGQILSYGRDVDGPIAHVAGSVRQLLHEVVATPDWEPPNPPAHEWLLDLDGSDLADLVAASADRSVIQFVHLRRADRLRLTDLAGLPHLRAIRVLDVRQKATHVDLAIPPGLPVEQVDVTAEHFAPERLATARSLRYVTLAGNEAPVQIAALAALPNLVRLDLAGAVVADVSAIANLPALRVLTLDAEQWQELLATGWTPKNLAAARLGGRGNVADAEWHDAMRRAGQPTMRHRTIRGPR
ncbi:SMI1 / KNR4 family (SUKH-1) [Asanoa hainanensis]|uniref:SMI1 / KNR4 family (SUKH-1) n=2 Tax=Asanoa hainanensis TaxID=560556 RepID=A0A239MEF5_9ACTN|nr:SMI1 / KNR4 family (SUKH-1) [Asanoa hainanensis]